MNKIRLLHISAHLGGGVGRVLSRVATLRRSQNTGVTEKFICLEPPEKMQFVDALTEVGIEVIIAPQPHEIKQLIDAADIVQLEWWQHPLLVGLLCLQEQINARLVVWSHTSGLHYPAIPISFISMPHAFLFTTEASLRHLVGDRQLPTDSIASVVYSSGGFDDLPLVMRERYRAPLRFGYLGALNFAKLHPEIISYLNAVNIPDFAVDFYGDIAGNEQLSRLSEDMATKNRMNLCGYTEQPVEAFSNMDVLVYLLNPDHYGTTENALLEAMASGVVPIVLDNLVEASIVKHGKTGLVVNTPAAFAEAISYANSNLDVLKSMSDACVSETRSQFSLEKTEQGLRQCYASVMASEKRCFDFQKVFGRTPSEWFYSCLGDFRQYFDRDNPDEMRSNRLRHPVFYEKSKSSVFHFLRYYEDAELTKWAEMLEDDIANSANA